MWNSSSSLTCASTSAPRLTSRHQVDPLLRKPIPPPRLCSQTPAPATSSPPCPESSQPPRRTGSTSSPPSPAVAVPPPSACKTVLADCSRSVPTRPRSSPRLPAGTAPDTAIPAESPAGSAKFAGSAAAPHTRAVAPATQPSAPACPAFPATNRWESRHSSCSLLVRLGEYAALLPDCQGERHDGCPSAEHLGKGRCRPAQELKLETFWSASRFPLRKANHFVILC